MCASPSALSAPIALYDTTLRDGAQQEGLSLSVEDKLRIARSLDALGIPFIEGGWPGANPKDVQFFWQLREEPLERAQVVTFCSTRRPGGSAKDDRMLQAILAAGTECATVFGKSWDLHVTEGLGTTLTENLEMIRDTIAFLRSQQRRVFYDAEHWFDAYQRNPDYALETLHAAAQAGAEWLVLCDTNGGMFPEEIERVTGAVMAESHHWPGVKVGIHTHNDGELAVANAIASVRAGAEMVQGTINGYGERCGNANLCSLIPNLQLKLGYQCIPSENMALLTETSRSVSEAANMAPDDRAPFVGLSAFAHKGGIHVSAVRKNPLTYEHLEPERVGNTRRIVVSEQAGISNIAAKLSSFGVEIPKTNPMLRDILQRLKQLEHQGYQFEAAEASFELLVRGCLNQRPQLFELTSFHVHCTTQNQAIAAVVPLAGSGTDVQAIATVKVVVKGETRITAAEGNGPVSALDGALRKALVEFYPAIADMQLADYKVRILDGQAGTDARTRVLIAFVSTPSSAQPARRWTTIGVSENIIEASYQALAEGLEYGLSDRLGWLQGDAIAALRSQS